MFRDFPFGKLPKTGNAIFPALFLSLFSWFGHTVFNFYSASFSHLFFVYAQDFHWCATNADCRLADWQVNEVNIVVKYSNRFPIPKLDFVEDLKV